MIIVRIAITLAKIGRSMKYLESMTDSLEGIQKRPALGDGGFTEGAWERGREGEAPAEPGLAAGLGGSLALPGEPLGGLARPLGNRIGDDQPPAGIAAAMASWPSGASAAIG